MDFSTPDNLLIAGIYYVIVGFLTFFSLFGVYVLIRYGQSRAVSLGVAVFYGIIFLSILGSSYATLNVVLR